MNIVKLQDPMKSIEVTGNTNMPAVMLKGLWLSMLRRSIDTSKDIDINKFTSFRKNIKLDLKKIALFDTICNTPVKNGSNENAVPMVYLQSLFIGLFGKYIISPYFPLVPMGLIHTKQRIMQKRPILADEILDATITLSEVTRDPKGFETNFFLELKSNNEVVWEGVSTFLSKNKTYKKAKQKTKQLERLPDAAVINVPKNTGRLYAKVSGDCNPFHISMVFAKLSGFRSPIAHGMWSLARSVSEIERQFPGNDVCGVDISFKLPLFLPGKVTLGAQKSGNDILFDLRDHKTEKPHIAGRVLTR